MHDLLLTGGRLIDSASGLSGLFDIAVSGTRIAAIAPRIDPGRAARLLDVSGKIVVPGLIDLHTHVYPGAMPGALSADEAGVNAGVTTLVDAGSAGSHTFAGFRDHVLDHCATRVITFLNIARTGLAYQPEIRDRVDIDVETTISTIQQHRVQIKGVKLRAIGPAVDTLGEEIVSLAKTIARETGCPLMVHIGEIEPDRRRTLTRVVLSTLEPGDILTHAYTPRPGALVDEKTQLLPEARDAYSRGVVFDVAHGVRNFSVDIARRLLDEGLKPHTISTDMAVRPRRGPAYSLTETMSKFLALGLSLEQVIEMATSMPAKALGMANEIGSLQVNRSADISVLDVLDGSWEFVDSTGAKFHGRTALTPVIAVRAGKIVPPDWGPHPWGWAPAKAEGSGAW